MTTHLVTPKPYWRDVLEAQGRSLRWLADHTGRARRTVYAYSQRTRRPDGSWLERVAELLGEDVGNDPPEEVRG